jgi:hypothetical protein
MFARRVFFFAPFYGLIALLPLYLAEWAYEVTGRPPFSNPELLYGFVGAAGVMQLVYFVIARDPVRFRPIMPLGMLSKISFFVPCVILYLQGRLDLTTTLLACVDGVLAVLFYMAWKRTPAS